MQSFKADLNYFLALLIAGSTLGIWFVAPIFQILLAQAGAGLYSFAGGTILTIAMVFTAIAIVRKRNGGLSPVAIASGCEKRYRLGGILAGIANVIVVSAVSISILGHLLIDGFGLAGGLLLAVAMMLAVPINIIGIVCIETSRQRK